MSYFSSNNVTADPSKAAKTYSVLPEGDYELTIESCEEKKSSKGDPMLSVKFKVEAGDHTGRFLYETIMLSHANPVVVEMGQAKLHSLMLLTGVTAPKSADEFAGRSVHTKVKVVKDKGTGEAKNEVVFRIRSDVVTKPSEPQAARPEPKGKKGGDW